MSGSALKLIGGVGLLLVLAAGCGMGSYLGLTSLGDDDADGPKVHHLADASGAKGAEGAVAALAEDGAAAGTDADDAAGEGAAADTGAVADADADGSPAAKALGVADRRAAKEGKRGKLSKAERLARAAQRDGSGIAGRKERAPAASAKKKKGKSLAECAALVPSAQQKSKTEVRVSQAFLDTYIRDMATGQDQGAAMWAKDKSGKRTGIRVKALRCGPRAAGLRNKDVVANIAGHDITTTANAYLAYNKVKKADDGDTFNISVLRKGQPVRINYTVGPISASGAEGAGE